MSSGVATDVSIIDQLGVQAVAEALSISPQPVSKWKQRGVIPQARRNQLRNLAAATGLARATPVESNTTSVVESVNRLPIVVPPGCRRMSARLVDTARITGSEALAQRVGSSNQHVSHLENGKRRLSVDWMERLATALECHPLELLHDGVLARTKQEQGLLEVFRGFSGEQQDALLEALTALARPERRSEGE